MEGGLGATSYAKLSQYARDVGLAPRQKPQNFGLTVVKRLGTLWSPHLAHQLGSRLGSELDSPLCGSPYGLVQLFGVGVLEQISDRPGTYRPGNRSVLEHAGKRYDLHLGQLRPDGFGGLYAVHHRHKQVHEDHIGLELSGHLESFFAVFGLTNHLEIRVERKEHPQTLAYHAVVVNYQEPYHYAGRLRLWSYINTPIGAYGKVCCYVQ